MSCGRIRSRKSIYVPHVDKNEMVDAPMPVFLITHPEGNVLFDTGPNPDVFKDASAVWGGLAKAFQPIGDKESGVMAQLRKIGYAPDDIKYVVNSHLHFDHSGGNRFFPNATFLVSKEEIKCARRPDLEGKGYFKAEWDLPLNYHTVEGIFDIFGDERLVLYPLPGHTSGHLVMLIRLEKHEPIILSGDSVPCRENFEQRLLARTNLDNEKALRSMERLHELASKDKAMIIFGHDSEYWDSLKKAPSYYE
jgi:glyoxylase-like metal-dependent hydrolase (beta-lactamase superfamily II)